MKTLISLLLLCALLPLSTSLQAQVFAAPKALSIGADGRLYVAAVRLAADGSPELWLLSYAADGTPAGEALVDAGKELRAVSIAARPDTLFVAGSVMAEGASRDFYAAAFDPDMLVGVKPIAAPTRFALETGYPNPITPEMTITLRFTVPYAAPVRIEVRSITGAEVATLADGLLEAGRHSAVFRPRGLASGTYYFMLTSPEGVLVRKIAVMK